MFAGDLVLPQPRFTVNDGVRCCLWYCCGVITGLDTLSIVGNTPQLQAASLSTKKILDPDKNRAMGSVDMGWDPITVGFHEPTPTYIWKSVATVL